MQARALEGRILTLEPVAVDEKALNGFVGRECPAAGFRAAVRGKGHGAKPSPPQTAGWAFAPYNHAVSWLTRAGTPVPPIVRIGF